MVLTLSLAVGRVGGTVWGVASNGRSLTMSPELSVRVVESRALRDKAPPTRLPSQLYAMAADSGAGRLFSPVLRIVRVDVGDFSRRNRAAAQVLFEGYAFLFT